MTTETLIADLEHRRDLAGELARYADGRSGLGLGTALSGLQALLNPVLIWLGSNELLRQGRQHPRAEFLAFITGRFFLMYALVVLLNAFAWLFLKGTVQARLYRRFGEAGSLLPGWEARLGLGFLCALGFAGLWIAGSTMGALFPQIGPDLSPFSHLEIQVLSSAALLGTLLLLAASWLRVRGWRNWLGWAALSTPFLLIVSAALFNDRHPGLFTIILLLALMAGSLHLPFMAIYVGIRDHLRYRRLVKELSTLSSIEEKS